MNHKAEKRILITGNGFDLALGLPTSYNDFIDVVRFVRKSADGAIDIQKALPTKFEKLNELYKLQPSYDLMKVKEEKYAANSWLNYFSTELGNDSYNLNKKWVDFERDIRRILLDLANLKKELNIFEEKNHKPCNVVRKGKEYISPDNSVSINTNAFERLARLLNWDSGATVTKFDSQSIEKIVLDLYKDLEVFSEIFKDYLTHFVMEIFHSRKFPNIAIKAHEVLTFNYTHIAQAFKIPCDHVHGDLSGCLIFGIDNANDLTETLGSEVLSFTKYFQTIFHKTYASQFKQEIKETPAQPTHYIFYGHSFDLSDKSYIEPIFNAVYRNDTQQITIYYDKDERRSPILRNLLDPRMLGENANDLIENLVAKGKLHFEHIESIIPISNTSQIVE